MNKPPLHLYRRPLAVLLAAGTLLGSSSALAYRWDLGSVQINFDSQLSYGMQFRTEDQDPTSIGNDNGGNAPVVGAIGELMHGPGGGASANPDFNLLNGDNGNLNYGAGDMVSGAIKGTHELGIRWGDGWEFLGRFSWLYDHQVNDVDYAPLSEGAKEIAEGNITPLDLWISKDLEIFGQPVKMRLGNQVVSWGEDVFILGGINSVNALDLRRFHTPGTQLKEVLRPAPMFYFNGSITDTISLEGYYQFVWNGFRFDPVGTFFSGADIVGRGQLDAYAPTSFGLCAAPCGDGLMIPASPGENVVLQQRKDRRGRDGGQYGFALRYIADSIDSEFAFYYERYHDKLPFSSFTFDAKQSVLVNPAARANLLGLQYFNEYGEDKDLFGFSANTKLGPVAVGAELSYRPEDSVGIDPTVPTPAGLAAAFGFPFQGLKPGAKGLSYSVIDGVSCGLGTGDAITPGPTKTFNPTTCQTYVRGFVEEEKFQGHLTGFYFIENDSVFGDAMRAVGASEGYVLAEFATAFYPNLDPRNVPYLVFPSYAVPDEVSAGYVMEIALTYPDLLFGANVIPQIDFAHDFHGTTPNALPFVEDRKSVYIGINFDWQSKYKANIGYSNFFGGGLSNIIKDRDFVAASVTLAF